MTILRVSIKNWFAVSPNLITKEDWKAFAKGERESEKSNQEPKVDHLPPLFRRRLSHLSKLSLKAAHDCLEGKQNVKAVFVSRYGEINTTESLLTQLAQKEALSPTQFSLSVHNTASGLYTISEKVKEASTAVSGGENSFEVGILSGLGMLLNADEALVVYGEELLSERYQSLVKECPPPHAVALLLSKEETGVETYEVKVEWKEKNRDEVESEQTNTLLFLKHFLNQEPCFVLETRGIRTTWQKRS